MRWLIALLLVVSLAQATEVTVRVGASSNDVDRWAGAGNYDSDITSNTLGNDGTSNKAGLRFTAVTVPQGATITSAKITFVALLTKSGTTVNVTIYGEDTADAAIFTTANAPSVPGVTDFDNRLETTASVAWNNVGSWTADNTYDSPDLTTIVQEIVNRADWASGNDMAFQLWDNSSTVTDGHRYAKSYDQSTTEAALLTINYTTASTVTLNNVNRSNVVRLAVTR